PTNHICLEDPDVTITRRTRLVFPISAFPKEDYGGRKPCLSLSGTRSHFISGHLISSFSFHHFHYSMIDPFIHSFIHSFVHSVIQFHSFIHSFYLFIYSVIQFHSFIQSFVRSFYSSMYAFIYSVIQFYSFLHSF